MVSSLLFLNVSNILSFRNLALFICHLFIDGHFRQGHILYDRKVFDDQLMTKIDSICSVKIPWLMTDISQQPSLPMHMSDRTEHYLQLIFFHPNQLSAQIHQFQEYFMFYRIFTFTSCMAEINIIQHTLEIDKLNPIFPSSASILYYDLKKDFVHIYSMIKNSEIPRNIDTIENIEVNAIDQQDRQFRNNSVDCKNVFTKTFGEYERIQAVIIRAPATIRTKHGHESFISFRQLFYANFFLPTFDASYINVTLVDFQQVNSKWKTQAIKQKNNGKHQKDILLEYEPIDNKHLWVRLLKNQTKIFM